MIPGPASLRRGKSLGTRELCQHLVLGQGWGDRREEKKKYSLSLVLRCKTPRCLMPLFLVLSSSSDSEENPITKFPKHSVLFKIDLGSSEVREGVEGC